MDDIDGLETSKRLRLKNSDVTIIFLTALDVDLNANLKFLNCSFLYKKQIKPRTNSWNIIEVTLFIVNSFKFEAVSLNIHKAQLCMSESKDISSKGI